MPNHPRVDTIKCPFCECQRTRVRDTSTFEYRKMIHIRRKRLCDHCGGYFTTVEMTEAADIPGTPQVFVEDLHPVDKSYTPPPKPAPLPHPLDAPAFKDPLVAHLYRKDPQPAKLPPAPVPPVGFISPVPLAPSQPPVVAPSVAAQSLSSPEKPPQAGRQRVKNPYSP